MEDYTAGRKGPTGVGALGGGLFGGQQQQAGLGGGLFGGQKPLVGGRYNSLVSGVFLSRPPLLIFLRGSWRSDWWGAF